MSEAARVNRSDRGSAREAEEVMLVDDLRQLAVEYCITDLGANDRGEVEDVLDVCGIASRGSQVVELAGDREARGA